MKKDKNLCLHLLIILPFGCHAEDFEVTSPGQAIHIIYKWPEAMFDLAYLFQSQVDSTGTAIENTTSAKAAGLNETK